MVSRKDWLNRPLPALNVMLTNVKAKIAGYKTAYGLTDAWIARVELICDTFIAAYAGLVQNRAAERDLNSWFKELLNGEPQGASAPSAPTFQTIVLPAGAFIGLLDEFREMMRFFKANPAYTEADGENLMIVPPVAEGRNPNDAEPVLKTSIDASGDVRVEYVKEKFSGLELQWRKVGTDDWLMADKSTEKTIVFKPAITKSPENIELRGIYLLKNQRIGKWSPIYTITV